MAVTTTYKAIRDNYIALIEAATPSTLTHLPYRRCPKNHNIRSWAPKSGSAAVRKFEFTRDGLVADPLIFDPSALERNEDMLLTLAYPVMVALYGSADLDDIEATMRSDARQLRDLIFSGGNYLAGQSAAFVTVEPADKADQSMYYQVLRVALIYTEAQSLT